MRVPGLEPAGADFLPESLKPEHLRAEKNENTELPDHCAHVLPDGEDGAVYDGPALCSCEKCARRLYQDGSADAGVSMKAPTHIDPKISRIVVASHENEHVRRDSYRLSQTEDVKVKSAQVRLFQRSCSECGVIYCSGGVTTLTLGRDVPMYKLMGHHIDEKA